MAVSTLISGRGRAIRPDLTRALGPIASQAVDADGIISIEAFEAEPADAVVSCGGLGLLIEYAGGTRGEGLRPLSVARVERRGSEIYLMAFCHVAGAPRRFKASEIIALTDPATGEVHRSLLDWLEAKPSADLSLLRSYRQDLVLLAFVGRADGQLCDLEIDQIEVFLDRLAIEDGRSCPSRASIDHMARAIAPEWTAAARACGELRNNPRRSQQLWRAIRNVADADRVIDPQEHALLAEIAEHLQLPQ